MRVLAMKRPSGCRPPSTMTSALIPWCFKIHRMLGRVDDSSGAFGMLPISGGSGRKNSARPQSAQRRISTVSQLANSPSRATVPNRRAACNLSAVAALASETLRK